MTTARTMKRVAVVASDQVILEDVPIPTPQSDEVLIQTRFAGICGSDLHALKGKHPFIKFPFYPGHEVVGEVASAGNRANAPEIGTRVVIEPNLVCGECKHCRGGEYNLCNQLKVFGCTTSSGGMANYFVIAADRIHKVPSQMSDLQAAIIEPLATAAHAVKLAGNIMGKKVVVLGTGPIGLLTVAAARFAGASMIVATDLSLSKRDQALIAGADVAVDANSAHVVDEVHAHLNESADIIFDCVSTQTTIDTAITLGLKGGTVVVTGVAEKAVTVPLADIQDKQLRMQGTAMYTSADYEMSIKMLLEGAVNVNNIITGTFPIASAAQAFEAAGSVEHLKVALDATKVAD